MDLWQLRIFQSVIEYQSFSKAAEEVHLTQPTVSSHIKDLENYFGCRLIDRMGKKALPTKTGELLYSYAQRLLTLKEETEMGMAEFQGKMSGKLTIGGSTIPGGYILPRIIGQFIKTYPDIRISLSIGDTDTMIEGILSNVIELGIVGGESNDKRIIQEKLIEDDMRVIVPANHPWSGEKSVDIKSLLKEPFIIREKGSGTLSSLKKSLASKGQDISDLNIISEMGSTESVIQGIKSMVGISILSPLAVSEALKAGSLKALTIKGINLNRCFYLTWHKNRSTSPLCHAFMEFIRAKATDF